VFPALRQVPRPTSLRKPTLVAPLTAGGGDPQDMGEQQCGLHGLPRYPQQGVASFRRGRRTPPCCTWRSLQQSSVAAYRFCFNGQRTLPTSTGDSRRPRRRRPNHKRLYRLCHAHPTQCTKLPLTHGQANKCADKQRVLYYVRQPQLSLRVLCTVGAVAVCVVWPSSRMRSRQADDDGLEFVLPLLQQRQQSRVYLGRYVLWTLGCDDRRSTDGEIERV
jgi:hypothetical protein